jgi:hypothetical protein
MDTNAPATKLIRMGFFSAMGGLLLWAVVGGALALLTPIAPKPAPTLGRTADGKKSGGCGCGCGE